MDERRRAVQLKKRRTIISVDSSDQSISLPLNGIAHRRIRLGNYYICILCTLNAFSYFIIHMLMTLYISHYGGMTNLIDDSIFDNILTADKIFRQKTGLSLIRSEAKLLILLRRNGSLSIKEAMSFLDLSYRGFYVLLNRMIEKRYISVKDDEHDKRVKRLYVNNITLL